MKKCFISIRKKMIVLYLTLLLLPICFIGMVAYRQYTSSMEQDVEIYLKQVSEQINANIERYIQEINKLTILPLYDEDIIEVLRKHAETPSKNGFVPSSEGMKMQMFMLSAGFDRPEICEIVFYTVDGIAFSSLSSAYGYEYALPPEEDTIREQLLGMGMYLTGPYEKKLTESGKSKFVVTVYRKLRDPYEDRDIGWIRIDLDEKMFSNMITPPLKNYPSQMYIVSDNQTIFYPTENAGQKISFLPQERLEINGNEYRCYTRRSEIAHLTVYQLIAEKDLTGDAEALVRFTFVLALIVVSIVLVLAIAFSYKLTQPIKDLSRKMALVEHGDFSVRAQIQRNDELGALCAGFNHMVGKIRELIVETYQTKLLKQEAELIALQNQLNPHFLYNTLNMINMSAIANRQFEISDIVVNLGKMLRYTINNENGMVPLRDELQFVRAYADILKIRVGDKLYVEVDCPSDLEEVYVPKLILQPLVENAFKHGLESGDGYIAVQVESGVQNLELIVADDGVGISLENLEKLRGFIVKESNGDYIHSEKEHGHALRNIYRRMQMLYGENAKIQIESSIGSGCVVSLSIPWQEIERIDRRIKNGVSENSADR